MNADLNFELSYDAWGRLVYTDAEGVQHAGVEPIRAFPISDPRRSVSLLGPGGAELLWIDRLDAVPTRTRAILENELAKSHFLPIVTRILEVEGENEPTRWSIETDRGPTRFTLKSEEDVRRLMGQHVMLVDAHGVRYLIPDVRQLDATSRRWMERYI